MDNYAQMLSLDTRTVLQGLNKTLRRIDPRLVDHGERVAFLACRALQESTDTTLDEKSLFVLSLFHDVGAYKTDEIDRMIEFETVSVWNHSIYGYLFLKNIAQLGELSEAVLYHHTDFAHLPDCPGAPYARYIHLADRADILMTADQPFSKLAAKPERFDPKATQALLAAEKKHGLRQQLADGSYRRQVAQMLDSYSFSMDEALMYLKLLVYSIDFRSEFTVTHTINTTAISVEVGRRLGLLDTELAKLYFGAFLHDLGKIAIPLEILDYAGKLNEEKMTVMRTHVEVTEEIIDGIVPDEIVQIAVRHHEKLDGTGYPHRLTAPQLTLPQRIVAVADIASALTSRRSYKEVFPRDKTIAILTQMKQAGQLDASVCQVVIEHYDEIMQATDSSRDPVIKMYQSIADEYQHCKERFASADVPGLT